MAIRIILPANPRLVDRASHSLTVSGFQLQRDNIHSQAILIVGASHKSTDPDLEVVILAARNLIAAALRAPAALLRDSVHHLPSLITLVIAGHVCFPRLDTLTAEGMLTDEEARLWTLIVAGTPDRLIGDAIGYSRSTTQRRIQEFCRLIGAATKHQAAALCARAVIPPMAPTE